MTLKNRGNDERRTKEEENDVFGDAMAVMGTNGMNEQLTPPKKVEELEWWKHLMIVGVFFAEPMMGTVACCIFGEMAK